MAAQAIDWFQGFLGLGLLQSTPTLSRGWETQSDSSKLAGFAFFHPAPLAGKLDSAKKLSVELTPGPKILPKLKGYSRNPNVKLIGFKLTDGAMDSEVKAAVERVLASGADLVVHNDVRDAAGRTDRRATLWDASGIVGIAENEAALARLLID